MKRDTVFAMFENRNQVAKALKITSQSVYNWPETLGPSTVDLIYSKLWGKKPLPERRKTKKAGKRAA